VVTATKRAKPLQKVPVSVSVTSEKTIQRAHIQDLIDLQSVVPSLMVSQYNAVGQTDFIIRGFGNGSGNDGIEGSVGVFVDGVYRSHSAAALDDLPDLDSIEVLRGPQSTLYGKNVSAGAIITKPPNFEPGAIEEVSVGNYGLIEDKASVTGPISDTVAYKLSASGDLRDGYMHNQTTGNDVDNRDRYSLRGDVIWEPSTDFSLRVLADYNNINELCCGVVSLLNGPATQFIGAAPPLGLGMPISTPEEKAGRGIIFNTDPQNYVTGKGISAQADWNLDFAKLTSITAFRRETNQSEQDVDFTGADLANKDQRDGISTFTQEVRLASTGSGPWSWLVGGFVDRETLTTGVDTLYGKDIYAYANGLSGGAVKELEELQHLVTPSIVPGETYFQPGQGIHDFYKMQQTSFSFFGQTDYKVTDALTLTGGLAYMNDHKQAESDVVLHDPFSELNLQDIPQLGVLGIPVNAFGPLGALQFFYGNTKNHAPVNFPNANESGILDGDKLTYLVRAAYDFNWVNAYFNYSTGWKAGAYNLSSDSRPPDAQGVGRTAGPENVTLYEFGLKSLFRGGFVNFALFQQTIDGFQLNDYTGTGYSLVNAGQESSRGFEVDAAEKPLNWLALTASATYLDPKYDSFTDAPCVSYDVVQCPIDPKTGLMPNFRNLSGTTPAGIPRWAFSGSATFSRPVNDDVMAYLRAEFDYDSKYQLTATVPPSISTYGNQSLNGSIGLSSTKHLLDVSVWVRNLTNYYTVLAAFPTVAQSGSYSGFPNQPRMFGFTLRKRF